MWHLVLHSMSSTAAGKAGIIMSVSNSFKHLTLEERRVVNGRKPAYWYRYGRNDKIQRDAFVNASPWIHYFWYYHHIIVRLAMLSGAL